MLAEDRKVNPQHKAAGGRTCVIVMRQPLNPSVSIPWFLVFAALPNTSSRADCILGNGKPQSCNHPSVLTHTYTLTFAATHSAYNLNMRLFQVCSSSMTEGFMGNYIFLLSCSHISWQAPVSCCHGVVLNNSLFNRQWVGQLWIGPPAPYISAKTEEKFRMTTWF